jgi:hypothetical protein
MAQIYVGECAEGCGGCKFCRLVYMAAQYLLHNGVIGVLIGLTRTLSR